MKGVCWLVVLGVSFTVAAAIKEDYVIFEGAYNSSDAEAQRAQRLYCGGQFISEGVYEGGVEFPSKTGPVFDQSVWTLFVQFPVLSYIDHVRKRALFDVIAKLVGRQDTTNFGTLDVTNFCIGFYDQYRVATYDEGVIVRVYFRDGDDASNINTPTLNTAFEAALENDTNFNNPAPSPFVPKYPPLRYYLGNRNYIAIDLRASEIYNDRTVYPGSNLLPEYLALEGQTPEDDPTLNAIVRFFSAGNVSREAVLDSDDLRPAANNPRPINYLLEAGDYVFLVIGIILLLFLLLIILIGYVIHPFFLA